MHEARQDKRNGRLNRAAMAALAVLSLTLGPASLGCAPSSAASKENTPTATATASPSATPRASTPTPTLTAIKATPTTQPVSARSDGTPPPIPTNPPRPTSTLARPTNTPVPPSPTPAAPPLQIKTFRLPLRAGEKANLVALTAPGANATITIYLKTGPSKAQGLGPQIADPTGRVSWSWTVEPDLAPGNYRVVVTAVSGGKTAQTETFMTIW